MTPTKMKSIFVLPPHELRKLSRKSGFREAAGFNYNAKNNPYIWPYGTCPRPSFKTAWQFRTHTLASIHEAALQLRVVWTCIWWDDVQAKPPPSGTNTISTETEVQTIELLQRRDVGIFGLRSEYLGRRITVPIDLSSKPRDMPKAKEMRREKKLKKLLNKGINDEEAVSSMQPTLKILKPAIPAPVAPVSLFIYPPPPQTGGVNVTSHDLARLNEGRFLNDTVIDFYLKYVFYEKLSDYHRETTHIFSSFFYTCLSQKSEHPRGEDAQKSLQLRRHNMVKKWTRHVDIFSKDFIVIPVNENVHWFLAIICYPGLVPEAPEPPPKPEPKIGSKSSDNVTSTDDQEENKAVKEPNSTVDGNNLNSDENSTASSNSMFESEEPDSEEPMPEAPDKNKRRKEVPCICIFDSLSITNSSRITTMLREYLEQEWNTKNGTRKIFDDNTMKGLMMQCPQQNNCTDCGIYLLQYVESFYESPLPYFDSPVPNLLNWFPKEKITKKRQELKDLIIALKKKYGSNTPTSTAAVTTPVRKQNVSDSVPSSPA